MGVGDNIRKRRNEIGLTVEDLAERVGLSPVTIYRYESGEIKNLKTNRLIPIAKALRTSPADLMMGEEDVEQLSIVSIEQDQQLEPQQIINNIVTQLRELETVQYGQKLTENELEMLNIFRSLSPEQQEKAKKIMQALV